MKCTTQAVLNQHVRPLLCLGFFLLLLLGSCAGSISRQTRKQVNTVFKDDFYDNHFTGFMVIDPKKKDTLFAINEDHYFTPASNVKIVTLFTVLQLLANRLPTLKYLSQHDTLFIEGTGDPSWLHPNLKDSTAIAFLKNYPTIALSTRNFTDGPFGPGWAWEDYETYFSPERGAVPLYGNVLTIFENDSLIYYPKLFKNHMQRMAHTKKRERMSNSFYVPEKVKDTLQIPYITNDTLTQHMLEQLTGNQVVLTHKMPSQPKEILYGITSDTLYKRMMFESDNFLAEQLMLVASSTLSDTLSFTIARDHILNNQLHDLTHPPRWVDGSGLSRYNLFTPESLVSVLQKLYVEIPHERLLRLFPGWNQEGTINKPKPTAALPFIYAKSGSLGNNYNLSGYLKTKSGQWLIFSFMNNHFMMPSSEVRQHIEQVLTIIHENY